MQASNLSNDFPLVRGESGVVKSREVAIIFWMFWCKHSLFVSDRRSMNGMMSRCFIQMLNCLDRFPISNVRFKTRDNVLRYESIPTSAPNRWADRRGAKAFASCYFIPVAKCLRLLSPLITLLGAGPHGAILPPPNSCHISAAKPFTSIALDMTDGFARHCAILYERVFQYSN
jgi:hypothetical protein